MELARRIEMEKIIGSTLVDELIAAGYEVTINNGGETNELPYTVDAAAVKAAMRATDEEHIHVRTRDAYIGWIFLVYGNTGYDTVCDYTINLTAIVDKLDGIVTAFELEALKD